MQLVNNMKQRAGVGKLDYKLAGTNGHLYVNNQLVKPQVVRPTTEDILTMSKEDKKSASNIRRKTSGQVSEKGNIFAAIAFETKDVAQVRLAYKQVLSNPRQAKASHNVLVYNVGESLGWIDDGEHGAGRFLASWISREKLENCAFIITRQYGGEHLGTRRFELFRQVANEAHGLLVLG